MNRVLVTRPQPGAAATADRLRGLGFDAIVLPLTEIRALPVEKPPSTETVDAVAVTSANALRHAPPGLIADFRHKTCFAVGGETAAAARKAGFTDVVTGPGDAAGLVPIMLHALPAGAHVLHLCGRVRVGGLEKGLSRGGLAITELEIYDAPLIPYAPETILLQLGPGPFRAVLVHSARAASRLAELVAWPQVAPLFAETLFFCLSSRIGAALAGIPQTKIFWAPAPEEAELLALLRRHLDART
ncbi:uroporphyrinogen-III synthase [Mesorhizobium sp. 1B3]|uniref:uroporphyrinogen-III synthase n=1 Tax=Mesorhizobium sp. 1B3 TaxID=3243599 RepID=UPI003D9669E7